MTLISALNSATDSLANVANGLAVVSQNIANAGTQDFAAEKATQYSLETGGVRSGITLRTTDAALQNQVLGENASSAAWQARSGALSALQPVLGTVGRGNDLGGLLTALQSSFSALLNDPSNQTQQVSVVDGARTLADGINRLAGAYGQARQAAQDAIAASVDTLNTTLGRIGALSDKIVALKSLGQSSADLENQRAQAVTTLSALADTRFVAQPSGDLLVFTRGGAGLPTHTPNPVSFAAATTGAANFYPGGGLPGIILGGTDITSQLSGGAIQAQINLRDATIPAYQGELDEFAQNLAGRFDAQGLTLFSDPTGAVPAGTGPTTQAGYIGFASTIGVNPAVAGNPALVRDGTHAVAGSPTGASAFTPNTGLAGFTTLITRVLDFALGTQVQTGVAQSPGATTGLGASGLLAAGFGPQARLGDFANALTASQAADSATADTGQGDARAVQTVLATRLNGETGVSVDSELSTMITLQNAYGASAKIVSAVQALWSATLAMVS